MFNCSHIIRRQYAILFNFQFLTCLYHCLYHGLLLKQGVALTGRNTTGPPSRAAPGELRCICECYRRRQTTDDDNRRQRQLLAWLPTLCVGYTQCTGVRLVYAGQ